MDLYQIISAICGVLIAVFGKQYLKAKSINKKIADYLDDDQLTAEELKDLIAGVLGKK